MSKPRAADALLKYIPIIAILIVAAILRIWNLTQYVPLYWDEAQYLAEVENFTPYFSVNAGSFALLKLGHLLIRSLYYPQIVAAFLGLFTVLGLYRLGEKIGSAGSGGGALGLLMAGQAALMPYYVKYSRAGLAEVSALAFFVLALNYYCDRALDTKSEMTSGRLKHMSRALISGLLLSLVFTCSFKFLLPTFLTYLALEFLLWKTGDPGKPSAKRLTYLAATIVPGLLCFLLVPLLVAAVSGYTGWLERAVSLSEWHSKIGSFRWAVHFLLPLHLYYLGGAVFLVCATGGAVFTAMKGEESSHRRANQVMVTAFAINLLFFGLFSHLQAARVYVLTLPFLVYASSLFVIRLSGMLPRHGRLMGLILTSVLLASMAYLTVDYLGSASGVRTAADAIARNVKPMGTVYANAKEQLNYSAFHSPYKRAMYGAQSYIYRFPRQIPRSDSALVVVNDPSDIVALAASWDKGDRLPAIDSTRFLLAERRTMIAGMRVIFSGHDRFFATPYYYLEDLYSWRSYLQIHRLLASCNDSIYVYK